MPHFIASGHNIPERLLWAHEEGRVVFFCGAGISYPAGLPNFKGLVDQMYAKLGTTQDPIEEQAYRKNQYDATFDLLERRYPGQRLAVRTALASVLKPKWQRKNATRTHEALLHLATDRKGKVRLVTTNFDRIFQRLIAPV
jgi:NAD-dependent SIR2 family protein deacetylase